MSDLKLRIDALNGQIASIRKHADEQIQPLRQEMYSLTLELEADKVLVLLNRMAVSGIELSSEYIQDCCTYWYLGNEEWVEGGTSDRTPIKLYDTAIQAATAAGVIDVRDDDSSRTYYVITDYGHEWMAAHVTPEA